jgi:hypothetical protein
MKTLKLILVLFALSKFIYGQEPQIGMITKVLGKVVTIKLETTPTGVKPASIAYVSKDLTGAKGPFGITLSSGWLDIGEVKIKSVVKNTAELEITKEKTDIVVNGKVQKQFVVGKKIKLSWTKP